MSRKPWRVAAWVIAITGCIQGCEAPLPSTPPSVAPTPLSAEEAWTEWRQLVLEGEAVGNLDRVMTLISIMAESPDGLLPLIDAVGDESVSPQAKIFAIMGLTPIRQKLIPYEGDIAPLTTAEHPVSVRTIATHLLGLVETPQALETVMALLDDQERAVRESALGVLITLNGAAVADRVQRVWEDPETTSEIRQQIIMGMSSELVEQFVPLYAEAILDKELTAAARYKAATVLGQLGHPEHIAILEQAAESDPDAYVRERAAGGLALLRASDSEAISSTAQDQ